MSMWIIILVLVATIGLVLFSVFYKKFPQKLNQKYFTKEWRYLQAMCAHKETWPMAVISADKLLDAALKKRRFSGKSMGERLVSAQRKLSNNDNVWYAHKLRNKIVHEQDVMLKEKDVREALVAVRQALKDLGAL